MQRENDFFQSSGGKKRKKYKIKMVIFRGGMN